MKKKDIKNWKLREVLNDIEVVSYDAPEYRDYILKEYNIPLSDFKGIDRAQTQISWQKIPGYFKFFLDDEVEENENENAFRNSILSEKEKMIITYGWKEPAVLIPTSIFIGEWEDFIASTRWETIMFSEDFELIMEVSRDYNLHSNFKIR